MKKLLPICIVFLVIIAIFTSSIFIWRIKSKGTIANPGILSSRGASYIKKKSIQDNTNFKNLNLTQKVKRINERVLAGNCFSFVVPFDTWDIKEGKDCSVEVATRDPSTRFVAFERLGVFDSIDTVEGVGFRRLKKEDYTETVKNINGETYYIFTKKNLVEYTAYRILPESYLILTMTTSGSDSYESEFLKILKSIELADRSDKSSDNRQDRQ